MRNKKTKKKLKNITDAFLDISGCGHCGSTWSAEKILGLPNPGSTYSHGQGYDFTWICSELVKKAYKLGRKDQERELEQAMHHFIETPPSDLKDEE